MELPLAKFEKNEKEQVCVWEQEFDLGALLLESFIPVSEIEMILSLLQASTFLVHSYTKVFEVLKPLVGVHPLDESSNTVFVPLSP